VGPPRRLPRKPAHYAHQRPGTGRFTAEGPCGEKKAEETGPDLGGRLKKPPKRLRGVQFWARTGNFPKTTIRSGIRTKRGPRDLRVPAGVLIPHRTKGVGNGSSSGDESRKAGRGGQGGTSSSGSKTAFHPGPFGPSHNFAGLFRVS